MILTSNVKRHIAALAIMMVLPAAARAEEFLLPDPAELATYSPEALHFYQQGLAAVDRVDYRNAYDFLAKAAQLQPYAVRLNLLTAGLGLKHGRSNSAIFARDYYDTIILSYENVLRIGAIDDDLRREVQNKLKIARDERDNLPQRDARREAMGGQYIIKLNREFVSPTPGYTSTPSAIAASPSPTGFGPAASLSQYQAGGTPVGPVIPGAATPMLPPAAPQAPYPTAIPGPQNPQYPTPAPIDPGVDGI